MKQNNKKNGNVTYIFAIVLKSQWEKKTKRAKKKIVEKWKPSTSSRNNDFI